MYLVHIKAHKCLDVIMVKKLDGWCNNEIKKVDFLEKVCAIFINNFLLYYQFDTKVVIRPCDNDVLSLEIAVGHGMSLSARPRLVRPIFVHSSLAYISASAVLRAVIIWQRFSGLDSASKLGILRGIIFD